MAATSTHTPEELLTAARSTRTAITALEAELLAHALDWAHLHPGDNLDDESAYAEQELPLAGPGAPTVAEFAIAEFALAIGLTTDQGRTYLGDALELAHRLPKTWTRVMAGDVPVWKARKVAQATRLLPTAGAGFVDRALAPVLHKCSFAQIERTVDAARAEHDPAAAEQKRIQAAERRHFTFYWRSVTTDGQVEVTGILDLADAVALDEAIAAKAATLDPALPLDVRRSIAAGHLATDTGDGAGIGREVVVYAHTRPNQAMVEVENTHTAITPDQLRDWCHTAGTKITIKPVIDLNEQLVTDSYEPTDRQKEQARLTHPHCVFPGCTRPSRRLDTDHIAEWPNGPTTSHNLAPLCRGHHRLKTHTAWTYHRLGPETFTWTSPLGQTYLTRSPRHTY